MSHAGTDNGSRIITADQLEQHVNPNQLKTIISYLNDKITTFLMSEAATEMKQDIKIEGDLVTSFFDSVGSQYDECIVAFLDEMFNDIDLIMNILNNNANEMVVFFTYLVLLLKKLNTMDRSFDKVTKMVKDLAREINDEHH
jgi:hypothetical protein